MRRLIQVYGVLFVLMMAMGVSQVAIGQEEFANSEVDQSEVVQNPQSGMEGGSDSSPKESEKNEDGAQGGKKSNNPKDAAERAAAQEMGRSAVKNMHERDRESVLQKFRDTLRGALLVKYALRGSSSRNTMSGYVMATREGRDKDNNYCREVEIDLIYNKQRHYERSTSCLHADGQWFLTPASEVRFSSVGANPQPPRIPLPGNGDWLPPVRN